MVAAIVVLAVVLVVVGGVFVTGVRVGGSYWQRRFLRLRLEAAKAERQMHDVTRQVFTSMNEYSDQRRRKQS